MSKKIDDYIQDGIYGPKEIKKEEKRIYLGSYRERVVLALTCAQVRKGTLYPQLLAGIKKYPKSKMLFNGHMGYEPFKSYVQLANKNGIPYRMVTDKESNSEYGLVLTVDYAIDLEDISIKEIEIATENNKQKKKWFGGLRKKEI